MKAKPIFLLVPDSFKGSITAREASDIMEQAILDCIPQAICINLAMADGGEGTVQAILSREGGSIQSCYITAPLGNKLTASYALIDNGKTAVIEMAAASGLTLVAEEDRNPLITTSYGTGELILDALDKNITKIILGIGGSATNDGGAGMVQALGVKFLDICGTSIPFGGLALSNLHTIDNSNIDTRLTKVELLVACDVSNPLCGTEGASFVFAEQKGVDKAMMQSLDNALEHYAKLIKEQLGRDVKNIAGAGAAGGLGAALLAFTNAKLERGVDLIMQYLDIPNHIKAADYIFTGEGRIDEQTSYGKLISGLSSLAKEEHKPLIAFAGRVELGLATVNIDKIYQISEGLDLHIDMANARENLRKTVKRAVEELREIEGDENFNSP